MYKRNSGGYGKQFIFKRINSLFSTPTWVYIVLTFLTGTFLSFGIQNGSDLTKNVGYSLLASLIAAVLIDAGNT